jgi:hypothetical protein
MGALAAVRCKRHARGHAWQTRRSHNRGPAVSREDDFGWCRCVAAYLYSAQGEAAMLGGCCPWIPTTAVWNAHRCCRAAEVAPGRLNRALCLSDLQGKRCILRRTQHGFRRDACHDAEPVCISCVHVLSRMLYLVPLVIACNDCLRIQIVLPLDADRFGHALRNACVYTRASSQVP